MGSKVYTGAINANLAEILHVAKQEAKLSYSDLDEKIANYGNGTINRYISGQVAMTAQALADFAFALRLDPVQVFEDAVAKYEGRPARNLVTAGYKDTRYKHVAKEYDWRREQDERYQ
jgi:hypothetical protein